MQNLKHENILTRKSKYSKPLFIKAKVFIGKLQKGELHSWYIFYWHETLKRSNQNSSPIPSLQRCFRKEVTAYLSINHMIAWSTLKEHNLVWTHLQLFPRWTRNNLRIHRWDFWKGFHSTFQISNYCPNSIRQKEK